MSKKSMIFTGRSVLAALSAAVLAQPALAGDVLRMKAGTIQLKDQSAQILKSALQLESFGESPRFFVIQFESRVTEADRAALESSGLTITRYLPDDALIVQGSAKAAALSISIDGVKAVSEYAPEWKVSEDALALDQKAPLLVALMDGADAGKVARAISHLSGVSILRTSYDSIVVEGNALGAAAVSKIDGIEWIEKYPALQTYDIKLLDQPVAPTDAPPPYTGFESGHKVANFGAAWARGYYGEGQIAAMADTGLDLGKTDDILPDFAGRVIKGYPHGWGSTSWEDSMGHGTHVAGSVVSNGASSNGQITGGASRAKFIVGGLWSPILNGLSFDTDFNKILGWPYKDGARVHTNSWGADSHGEYDAFANKVDSFMWDNPDMLVLFAAGNSGQDLDKDGHIDPGSVGSPGTAKNVLTVGASENLIAEGGIQKKLVELRDGTKKWGAEPIASDTLSNNPNGIAAFSSTGPTKDGRLKPEIVAPGTNIVSTRSRNPDAEPLWGPYGDHYLWAGGTSMATPITAGGAVIAREYLVKAKGIANPSGALVKATLIHTAKDLAPGQYGTGPQQELQPRPDNHQGYGRLDLDTATAIPSGTLLVDNRSGVGLNEDSTVTFTVGSRGTLRATLTYADAPAAASAAKTLVNDLDLGIVDPSGNVKTLNDHINNTEMIELKNLAAGTYKVVVRGTNVPQGKNGKVPFALVVSE